MENIVEKTKRLGFRKTNLETENDGPNEAKSKSRTPIDNVMRPHILQMNTLIFEESESFVNIFQAVNPHFSFRWSRLDWNKY